VHTPQLAVTAVGAALAVAMLPLAAHPSARAAGQRPEAGSEAAWRLVMRHHYGARGNLSGYTAVVAPGRDDAWMFGGTNPGGASSPTAEHWNGRRWRAVPLPDRLGGFIIAASASSPHSVWAVSYFGTYVVHWNGRAWTVAKRWRHATLATSITAVSASDVWVFSGGGGLGTWHFNGRHWIRTGGAAGRIYRASALGRSNIWAITRSPRGRQVERYDGRAWRAVRTGRALARAVPSDILAVSRDDVWVSGLSRARLVVAHWNGARWTRFVEPWRVLPRRFATDGRGGIWIPAARGPLFPASWILHLSPDGRWTRTKVTAGLGAGVGDLARIPGTRSLWGSGGIVTRTGGDAAVWAHGRVPVRARIRQAAQRRDRPPVRGRGGAGPRLE
jgi:hypothetical protein